MKVAFRVALAVTLLAGVYFLAAGIAVAMVSFGIWFMQVSLEVGVDRLTAAFFLMLALIGVFALLMGLFYRNPSATFEEPGVVLTEDRHPGLWSEVRSLADTVGTSPPDEIRLVPEINAAVHDTSKLLGLIRGKRRLYIGAPLLIGFDRQQLRAVLAHELAHYSRRHTSLGGVTFRGQEALAAVVERFGRRSIVRQDVRPLRPLLRRSHLRGPSPTGAGSRRLQRNGGWASCRRVCPGRAASTRGRVGALRRGVPQPGARGRQASG